jgi:hypothetical protein
MISNRSHWWIATLLLAAALSSACTGFRRPNLPWRTVSSPGVPKSANPEIGDCKDLPSPYPITIEQLANEDIQRQVRCRSNEEFTAGEADFKLHVVEFDDQGLFWNRAQVQDALADIREVKARKQDVLVVAFFHGWFNNADVCNDNLACFRELLALVARAEHSKRRQDLELKMYGETRSPRKVIGIAAGWRGRTLSTWAARYLTFWGRKGAAHTIGENGAVTELISSAFNAAHATLPGRLDLSSFVAIGHSFGGALLMSAVGNELNRAAGEAISQTSVAVDLKSRLADLVVLVNPAVEASRFDNVRRAAATARFKDTQLPLLLTLSSAADWPNKTMFPIGQSIAFAQKSARSREQWQGMIQTLGTFQPNQTHHLLPIGDPPPKKAPKAKCLCDAGISAYGDALLESLFTRALAGDNADFVTPLADPNSLAGRREFLYSHLEPVQDVDPNGPFLMVQAHKDVIGGHSDIFNPRIVDFLVQFVFLSEAKRTSLQAQLASNTEAAASAAPSPTVAPAPATAPPGPAACFSVKPGPDEPVYRVHLEPVLPPRSRLVRVQHADGAFVDRWVDLDEREFPFRFARTGAYVISALGSAQPTCSDLTHDVYEATEEKPGLQPSFKMGLGDWGAQFGAGLQLKTLMLEASVIKPVTSLRTLSWDVGFGIRENRAVYGAGYRWRYDFEERATASETPFIYYSLELPGAKLLGKTWSSWLGLEGRAWGTTSGSPTRSFQPSVALRLQLRVPRESWLDQ